MKLSFILNVLALIVLAYLDICIKSCVCQPKTSRINDMYSYGRPAKYRSAKYRSIIKNNNDDSEPNPMSDRKNDLHNEDGSDDNDSNDSHRKEKVAGLKSKARLTKRSSRASSRAKKKSRPVVRNSKKPMMKISDLSKLPKTSVASSEPDPDTESKVEGINRRSNPKDGLGKSLSLTGCGIRAATVQRIVGGVDANEGAHPWIAAILKDGNPHCAGSILNNNWIITASHCFMGENPADSTWALRVGTINRNEGQTYKVKKVITHDRFNLDQMLNSDIALMQAMKPIEFSKLVVPVCLPDNSYDEPRTDKFLVAGWGAIKFDNEDMPVILQEVSLNIVKDSECAKKYRQKKYTLYKSQVCTWNYKKDACQGDSGGPGVEIVNGTATLVGVVSYGSTCADDFPGVYTQVSYFLNWLRHIMKENPTVR